MTMAWAEFIREYQLEEVEVCISSLIKRRGFIYDLAHGKMA
jgi:hypothetical protein